jgi:hypothetical protein
MRRFVRIIKTPGYGILVLAVLAIIVTAYPVADAWRAVVVLFAFLILWWELRCIRMDRDERDQRHIQIIEMMSVDSALATARGRTMFLKTCGEIGQDAYFMSLQILEYLSQRQHALFAKSWNAEDQSGYESYLEAVTNEWRDRFDKRVRDFVEKLKARRTPDHELEALVAIVDKPATMRVIAEQLGFWVLPEYHPTTNTP